MRHLSLISLALVMIRPIPMIRKLLFLRAPFGTGVRTIEFGESMVIPGTPGVDGATLLPSDLQTLSRYVDGSLVMGP